MNTQFLFPLALGMASAIFVYCFTDRKKFGAPLSIVVGLIAVSYTHLTLPTKA